MHQLCNYAGVFIGYSFFNSCTPSPTCTNIGPSELFNRKRQDVPVKKLHTIHAQMNIRRMHLARLLRGVEVADVNFPNIELTDFHGDVKSVVQAVKAMWHIPPGPINNVTEVIENNGGIIIPFDFGTNKIDAFSICVPDTPPLYFINLNYPGDRLRFTLLHETAHIIMHQKDTNPDMEKQADTFAAEFLMPTEDISPFLKELSLQKLAELKLYWKCSMASILKHASDLGEITPSQARNMWIKMSSYGYRTKEPPQLDIPLELPTLYREIIEVYNKELGYTISDFSKMLNINEDEARHIYFSGRKQLRVIK